MAELGFWKHVKAPFFVTAPLANVTDVVFRAHLLGYSRPDVLWTEFVSADGLAHPKGREALLRDLDFREAERPIVAQLFTAHPEHMQAAARLAAELGFDGVDINMGCPDKNVVKQGAGAACIKDKENAAKLVFAAREGTREAGRELPISIKTRLGFQEDELERWLPALLATEPAAVTLHARTKKELSKVPARFERVKRAVEIRDALGSKALLIGNGDVIDMADARQKIAESGADGIMFGRALFGNPWIFDERKESVTAGEKIEAALSHTRSYVEHYGTTKSFELMKKHYRAYINHFPLAKELRAEMMEAKTFEAVQGIVERFRREHAELLALPASRRYLL
jgi:nifR3 family TIM-barrel protein